MSDRPYHHGNLRTALLEQAERTVRQRGVQELSLRELARDVGVSHGAPRRHFPDRQALLDALAEAGFVRLADELSHAIEGAGTRFPKRLQAMATAYVHFASTDPELLELMFAGKQRDPNSSLHDAGDRAFAVILELIKQGQATGYLDEGDPERIGLILFSALQGIASLVTVGMVAAEHADEVVGDAVAHFLRGALPQSQN